MNLAESFLSSANDLILMSENIKRLESRLDRAVADIAGVDRRVMKIEIMIELTQQAPRKRAPKELP